LSSVSNWNMWGSSVGSRLGARSGTAYHSAAGLERRTFVHLLLTVITTLLAGTLVVLVPGAALLATMRLDRIVPPPLVPAAALALGLVPLAVLLSATLLLHRPIEYVAIGLALVVLACWSTLATREARSTPRDSRVRARARGWILPIRDLVAGEWMRGTPALALLVAVAGGVLAIVVGFHAWDASLYHIGQAQKLLALDAPTFSNTLQFEDGTAHPGYFIPAWQEVIALTAFVGHVDPVTAAWILPGLTFAVSLLAFGGLGWAATRTRGATSVVALALLVVTIGTLPNADPIINAMQPGIVGLGVLAPLILGMLFGALWPDTDPVARRHGAQFVPAWIAARGSTCVAVVATAELGMLHVSYLWVVGMGILGYYLVWLLRMPWPRDVVRRHLATGAAIALVAATCVALLLPGLNSLETSGLDAKQELQRNDSPLYEGENDANLDALLRGDPAGAFHLRSDYLVLAGGLALLGLMSAPLLLLAPRWPAGWYVAGSSTLVLGIALSDELFPRFVEVVTLDQARRIERVLPLVLALGIAALAVGALATWLWRRGGPARFGGVAVAAGATAIVAYAADAVPALAGDAGERLVHPRVLVGVLVLLLVALVLFVVLRVTRRELASWDWPTHLLGRDAVLVAFTVLLVGAIPVYHRIGDVFDEQRLENVPIDLRDAEMRLFAPNVARELRKLPPGSVVLADPRTRNAYVAMAIAPVYVVSSVPRHTALTPKNHVTERFQRALSFFEGDFQDGLTLDQRINLLRDERVDAIVMHPLASTAIRKELDHMPGVRLVVSGKNQRLYVVDRSRLPRDMRGTTGQNS
jgi:hypothetical protein